MVSGTPAKSKTHRIVAMIGAEGTAQAISDRRRWGGLVVLSLGQLMVGLDLMVMLIALPTIDRHLKMSADSSQWVITSYALTYGALLLLGGRIADYGGRKRAFVAGLLGFALASTLGGAAPDTASLLIARGLQGVFAALMMPAALSLVSVMFTDEKQRARALAAYGAVAASGIALGMVLGGVITQYTSWRWCLLINPPLCALTLVGALLILPESRMSGHPRYDVPGALLGTLGLGAAVYGFAHAGTHGWGSPTTLGALGLAALLTAVFVVVEARTPQPLLPLRLLSARLRAGALLAVTAIFTGVSGLFLFLIFYLQGIKHDSAVRCGLALLPYAIAAILAAGILEQPLGRIRREIPIVLGLIGAGAVCLWFGFLGIHWDYAARILPAVAFLGVCVVTLFIAGSAAVFDDAPDDDSGVCGALFNIAPQLGIAIGPALLTSIALQATRDSAHGRLPLPQDLVHGYRVGSMVAAGVCALGALLALALIRSRRTTGVTAYESSKTLLALGTAARHQCNAAGALQAHERAYRLARERDDARSAGQAALELVLDCALIRSPVQAAHWLKRAMRMLDQVPTGDEHQVMVCLRARFALKAGRDPDAASALAHQGAELAQASGSFDRAMVCRALEGLALVAGGRVEAGMQLLDQATGAAMSGEISSTRMVEVVCWHLIEAYQLVRDFDRAGEWCVRLEEIATLLDDAEMVATARTLYGEVLLSKGDWREAEETLGAVARDFAHAEAKTVDALVWLAELRRRQGRSDDAAALLARTGEHPVAAMVRAALALDRGDVRGAATEAERYLRGVGARDRFERVPALELLVPARLALGDTDGADAAAGELEAVAAMVTGGPLLAAALLARGRVESARDPGQASASLREAADLLLESGVRYEAAQARLELASVLRGLGCEAAAGTAERRGRAELDGVLDRPARAAAAA
jgi:EmrB/QacA subfamily drug resistance transporter